MTETINHWIDGREVAGVSTRTQPVYDPALGTSTKEVRLGSAADVDAAVASALAAFGEWGGTSWARRQSVIFAFRELLNARKEDLAQILTAEHGKVL